MATRMRNRKELAFLFDVSVGQIDRFIRLGAPRRSSRGYDTDAWTTWMHEYCGLDDKLRKALERLFLVLLDKAEHELPGKLAKCRDRAAIERVLKRYLKTIRPEFDGKTGI